MEKPYLAPALREEIEAMALDLRSLTEVDQRAALQLLRDRLEAWNRSDHLDPGTVHSHCAAS